MSNVDRKYNPCMTDQDKYNVEDIIYNMRDQDTNCLDMKQYNTTTQHITGRIRNSENLKRPWERTKEEIRHKQQGRNIQTKQVITR